MSADRVVRLRCDVVDCSAHMTATGLVAGARELAKTRGWSYRPTTHGRMFVDVCPTHGTALAAGANLKVTTGDGAEVEITDQMGPVAPDQAGYARRCLTAPAVW